jgi:uncharacterized protein
MNISFFRRARTAPGRNSFGAFLLTIVLVITGIIGFGNLPLILALNAKGFSMSDIQHLSNVDMIGILGRNGFFVMQMIPMIIGFLMLLFGFRYIHMRHIRTFFTLRSTFDLGRFGFAFMIWAAFFIAQFAVSFAIDHSKVTWNFQPAKFAQLFAICIFLVPLQTGFEELLFRGHILQWTGKYKLRGAAVIALNGLLFAALHFANPEAAALGWPIYIYYFMSGAFAALVAVMDDGIELSWGFHAANNIMILLILSNDWQVIRTDALFIDHAEPALGYDLFATLFIAYPLMTWLFAKRYKWRQWKERLFS